MIVNRQVVIARMPQSELAVHDFDVVDGVVPTPRHGEILVRTVFVSLDPVMRLYLLPSDDAVGENVRLDHGFTRRAQPWRDLRKTMRPGDVMDAFTLCEVLDPNGSDLQAGSLVVCSSGAQQYAAIDREWVREVQTPGPLSHLISALGVTGGITAYVGMVHVTPPRPGDTVVVSSAAGSVGSVAGQIARLAGARVIGLTSSEAKGDILKNRLRFDATVDYRDPDFVGKLREVCPDGVDVYFDNVGGSTLESVLEVMADHGRVNCCGNTDNYNRTPSSWRGPSNLPFILVVKRLQLLGFAIHDAIDLWPEAESRLEAWLGRGDIVALEHITDGIDEFPSALVNLYTSGDAMGKRMVRVGPDPV